MPNALIHETSPYLRQHAHNPVDWHPWSEEALRIAKQGDKPILLSIGYSACHWCHVMERESFENPEIAALMNELFVNIKVDREERPDLDAIYMQAIQMITGRGGWPMTVFLTPDGAPFYGGTYFPPEDRHGMPGFPKVLRGVAQAYREKKKEISTSVASIMRGLETNNQVAESSVELTPKILEGSASHLLAAIDGQNGGFGTEPKFPQAMALDFLLRSSRRSGATAILEAVELTLQRMACGGIYDQIGGGFHRYSVDAHWLIPHFEKMLYDNALLSRLYLHAYLATGKPLYRRIAEETLAYVRREMAAPEGGFYSTQDADSEGLEGKFYTWERREVDGLLDSEEGELFSRYYGITHEGSLEGRNVLYIPRSAALVARLNGVTESELEERIECGRKTLFAARERRVRPARDEKILAAWNGLMLRSFAEAARSFDREDFRSAAVGCAEFLLSRLGSAGRLLHSYKDGQARIGAFLDDYACVVDGLLALYESTFDAHWLREAARLAAIMIDEFLDSEGIGFFMTGSRHESLIHRPKEFFDNATPSGNSAAVHSLLRLTGFTGDESYARGALPILKALSRSMAQQPAAYGNFLCALDFALSDALEIAVVGNPEEDATRALLRELFRRYLPNKLVACGDKADVFLLENREQISGRPTVYICRNRTCQAPINGAAELAAKLATV